jgi:hypothetical protein
MSPKMKKILLIGGGAAVVGFIAYRVIKKKPAATVTLSPQKAAIIKSLTSLQSARLTKMAGVDDLAIIKGLTSLQVAARTKMAGVESELGASEDLGSLGGGWR